MTSRFAAIMMTAVMAFAPAAFASGKKEDKASVSFHIETEGTDNPKMIFPLKTGDGKTRYFRRMSEINTKDLVSFNPFPADGGQDYGVVFKLKGNAANRFAAITNVNQGRWLLAQINGRRVDGILIDKQVNDGLVVIWKGVTLEDIAALDKEFPRIGQEGKKKEKKKAE